MASVRFAGRRCTVGGSGEAGLGFFHGRTVALTGGAGSIGSRLAMRLLALGASVRVIDRDRAAIDEMRSAIANDRLACHAADVTDSAAVARLLAGAQLCIHAAAEKDLSFCEDSPAGAIATNVLGSQNVAVAAALNGLDRTVLLSSDKAVAATSCLGSTKLLAEKLFAAGPDGRTQFPVVRLCNVLGSARSIVPLMCEKSEQGEPITITGAHMSRYFITMDDAAALILEAASGGRTGELFIPKPQPIPIMQLARVVVALVAPLHGYAEGEIEIIVSGRRAGEKLFEELVFEEERGRLQDRGDYLFVAPHESPGIRERHDPAFPLLSDQMVRELLLVSGAVPSGPPAAAAISRAGGQSYQQPVAREGLGGGD